ncbi:MAG: sel1 repeat family protein [Lachnospiraceae bacterium]|nr:sel1 repeat family protein [Lachnospiraceae bacterium]
MSAATMEELYNSATAGDTGAMVEYGRHLLFGIDCSADAEGAVACFSQAAELGSKEAARELGYCCLYGTGTPKNDQKATDWFRKGAELGDAESMYKLFQNLSIGVGCSANIDEADAWLEKAKDLGYEKAQETFKGFSDGKMLSKSMKASPRRVKAEGADLLDADLQAGSLEKLVPSTSYDLNRMALKDASETQIVSQEYHAASKAKTSLIMILVYALIGAASGFLISTIYSRGRSVLSSNQLYNYLGNNSQIRIYLLILGAVFGLALGFVFSLAYKKSSVGLLFFLPAVVLPYLILMAAAPLMPLVIGLGKLLYGLLTIVIGLIGVYCVCASSS